MPFIFNDSSPRRKQNFLFYFLKYLRYKRITQTTRPHDCKQKRKKRTCQIGNFAVPTDHKIRLKESEKRDKYIDLARELKKTMNIKVAVMPVVIGAHGTIPKVLVKGLEHLEIRGKVETMQTTALLRSTRILRRVLET